MFPITDFSRADDIRKRRRRAFWLLAGIVVVPTLWFSSHGSQRHDHAAGRSTSDFDIDIDGSNRSIRSNSMAATQMESVLHRIPLLGELNWTIRGAPLPGGRRDASALSATGASLLVSLRCAGSITLVPQHDLSGRVFVSERDGSPAGGTGLLLTGGASMVLEGTCRHGGSDLVVQAPASMPLTLAQFGSTDFRLGAFDGPVHLTQHGSGDVVIDAAGRLDIEKSGPGDVSIDRLGGALQLSAVGSGDVAIAHIQADHVQIAGTGSGDVLISGGHIDRLDATMRGSGDLTVMADVGEASVLASNNSDIKLPHVKGRFQHDILGE